MKRIFVIFLLSAVCFLPSLFMGCGGERRPDGMPRLYPASIQIMQEGTPLDGATVTLVSEDAELGRWAPTGITDASGVAVMQTNGLYSGAPLGTFKVVVAKRLTEPHPNPELAAAPHGHPDAARYDRLNNERKTFNYVATQYSSIAETPLSVEIVSGQRTYSIDVGERVREEVRGP